MLSVKNTITLTLNSKLAEAAEKSRRIMQKYKENAFKSKTISEMLSDKFEYKGKRPGIIYIKNAKNGRPVEAKLVVDRQYIANFPGAMQETYSLKDDYNRLIGEKTFIVKRNNDGTYRMLPGEMVNYSRDFSGVGFRLDQIQIERALMLNISAIPRDATAKATLYHTKMGFLPVENRLVELRDGDNLDDFVKKEFNSYRKSIPLEKFVPIVVQKDGKFYIDINKTIANANLQKCKEIIERTKVRRILALEAAMSYLRLGGEELMRWKKLLEGHSILERLKINLSGP